MTELLGCALVLTLVTNLWAARRIAVLRLQLQRVKAAHLQLAGQLELRQAVKLR